VHHVICDARGVEVLAEQLLALIAGNHEPAGRRSLDAAELALLQRSRGTDERTLRYFSKIYRSMPAPPFDEGAVTGDGRRYVARFSLRSSAGHVRRTADACEVSSHSVMLTLSVLLFGELSESVSGVFQVFGENRAIPELRETIDCLTQDVPLLYRFRYDEPFADVCRRIHRSSMRAYAVGPWDVGRVGELRADIERERHLSLRVNQDFNYLAARGGPTAAAAPGHLDQTERHAVQTVDGHGGSVFSVKVVDQEGIRVDITASPALVSRARMAGLDDAVESCLSCVSADASISVGRLMPVITRALGRRR
jgi:hypothetical protein